MYVATRELYNLKPPTVFVPPCMKEDVEKLLDVHRAMSKDELKLNLVPLDVGKLKKLLYHPLLPPPKSSPLSLSLSLSLCVCVSLSPGY